MSDIRVGKATEEDRKQVEDLARASLTVIKSFPYLWARFGGWEKAAPWVAFDGEKVVGFSAAQYLKKDYIYSYYTCVDPEYMGKGIGRLLLWKTIEDAKAKGLPRFKAKAETTSYGFRFLDSLGFKPIARKGVSYSYDVDISSCSTMEEFYASLKAGTVYTKPTDRMLKIYRDKEKNEEMFYDFT